MGGTGGTPTQMGGSSSLTSASNPNSFAGSRAALQAATPQPANSDFSDWLATIPDWAGGQSFINALASNPVPVGTTPAAALAAPSFIPSAGNAVAGVQSVLPGFEIDP